MAITWDQTTYDAFHSNPIRWADETGTDTNNLNGERKGEVYGYGRDFALYAKRHPTIPYWFFVERAAALINWLEGRGLNSTHRILIVGCGFGYLQWAFRHAALHPNIANDYSNCWGIDVSSYIEGDYVTKSLESGDAVFDDFAAYAQGNRVKNKLTSLTGGNQFTVVINFLNESFDLPTELTAFQALLANCELALDSVDTRRVVNIVDNALAPGEDGTENKYQTHQTFGTTLMTLDDWSLFAPQQTWIDAIRFQVKTGVLA